MLMDVSNNNNNNNNQAADCDKIMIDNKDDAKASLIQHHHQSNLLHQFSTVPSVPSVPFTFNHPALLPHAQQLSALIAAQQHQTAILAAAVAADRSSSSAALMQPPSSLISHQPQIIMGGVAPAGLLPSQILKVFTIPTPDGTGFQIVLQQEPVQTTTTTTTTTTTNNSQQPSDSTKKTVQINTDRPFSNSSMPLKKRHRYENEADSTSNSPSSNHDDNSRSSSNSPSISIGEDSGVKCFRSPVIQANPHPRSTSESTTPKKRPYHHQPKDSIPEERLKNMSPEEVKRERNRLAADRCRKKKMAKIDDLSKEVQQMERQRRQVLFQLDSLRHAALSARDAVRSHKTAGCSIADEHGALARLIMEAEALDKFVKSQL